MMKMNSKMTVKEYLKRIEQYVGKEVFVKIDGNNILIKRYDAKYEYDLKECSILFVDEKNIFLLKG
ncbi:MAG: hypothetical protein E7214_14310 [Clostridium sp.]|nr:hypothetical protein [Clostridium sp.]